MGIVDVAGRPELAALVAQWRVAAFFDYPGGMGVAEMLEEIVAAHPFRATFVMVEGGVAVGTAGMTPRDLVSRPDLSPWLAGVYVEPGHRGRGHATALIRRVEAAAAAAGVGVLWLYTRTAAGLYGRLGWVEAGLEVDAGYEVVLMRRDLVAGG